MTCRTVQVFPKCLRLSTIPAVHCIVAAKWFDKGSRINSTHPSSGPAGYHRLRKRGPDPCAQALLLTGAPGCPTESATGSRQCNSLQCSLVHGSGRLHPTPLTEQDRRARGTKQQDSQDKQNNKRIRDKPTSNRNKEGEEVKVAGVCVCVVGADGPLPSLVTSVS